MLPRQNEIRESRPSFGQNFDAFRGPSAEAMRYLSGPMGREFAAIARPDITSLQPHRGSLEFLNGFGIDDRSRERDSRLGRGRESDPERRSREPGSPALTGNSRADQIYNFLRTDLRLSRAQAAGVLGNFIQETASLDPSQKGDGGNSLGIAQWNGPRRRQLQAFATENGTSATDLGTQLKFFKRELETTERGAMRALLRTTTPEQAAVTFSRTFERPGNPMNGKRVANARSVFARFQDSSETTVARR